MNNSKKEEIIIDAKNKSLGRLGTEISYYLQGKHSTNYDPSKDQKIFVFIKNFEAIKFEGKKFDQKKFLKHTGYLGHLKEIPLKLIWQNNKLKLIQSVVNKMLPKNKLRQRRIKRIKLLN